METSPGITGQPEPDVQQCSERALFTGNTLKTIAIAAMLIDHIAHAFVPPDWPLYTMMRLIGRITGPTMFYFIVEGYHHTRNKNRYTIRLALFAVISYFPFVLFQSQPGVSGAAITDNLLRLNVIYTLTLGLLLLRARHEIKNVALKAVVVVVLFALSLPGDWSYLALLMILVFDVFRGDFKKQAFGYCMVILGFGGLFSALIYPLQCLLYGMEIQWNLLSGYISQFGMFIPILLLYFYNGRKGRGGALGKWGFYAFYPAHLLILGLIRYLSEITIFFYK